MTFQPGANLYTQGFGSRPENIEVPHYDKRAPSSTDVLYPIGKEWIWPNNSIWKLLGLSTVQGITSATWVQLADSDGPVNSVLGTTNQIAVNTLGGVSTVSLPAAITTPGSLVTTGALGTNGGIVLLGGSASLQGQTDINTTNAQPTSIGTGGTGSVNIGNVTGNTVITGLVTFNAATQGIVNAVQTNTGASPLVANGRAFSVIFTGVSIAAGATQSFTIQNSTITGASTRILYTLSGATSGAALTIQSVTNTAGQSVVVVQNGTGATTTTANLTLTGLLIN